MWANPLLSLWLLSQAGWDGAALVLPIPALCLCVSLLLGIKTFQAVIYDSLVSFQMGLVLSSVGCVFELRVPWSLWPPRGVFEF